ncbi:MAG: NUDIX hydrolase [Caldilineaceae bacterium]
MNLKQSVEPEEMRLLEKQWGPVPQRHHQLTVAAPFLTGEHQLLTTGGRRAEICYIMHRGDPAQGLLLHIKTFYPTGAFRLPTGGIHEGEAVMETLAREIEEETGLLVGPAADQVQVQRCLGLLSYAMDHRSLQRTEHFATYHFLVQMPKDATLNPKDPTESIGGWQWRTPAELPAVADYLEQVGTKAPDWGDWGRYRALSHRFVADILNHKT